MRERHTPIVKIDKPIENTLGEIDITDKISFLRNHLTSKQQRVFSLYVQGMDLDNIAEELRTPRATVDRRMDQIQRRARRFLEKC